jgi:prepilin-type N-terminal cleavage/methylation domain-containing protein
MQAKRGFTLIELLVVAAIIAVFSAVAIILLSQARSGGNDSAIKANLHTIIVESEIFFAENGNKYNTDGMSGVTSVPYACPVAGNTMFSQEPNVRSAIAAASNAGASQARCYMPNNGLAYAVQVPLQSGGYWCISSAESGSYSETALTSATCP